MRFSGIGRTLRTVATGTVTLVALALYLVVLIWCKSERSMLQAANADCVEKQLQLMKIVETERKSSAEKSSNLQQFKSIHEEAQARHPPTESSTLTYRPANYSTLSNDLACTGSSRSGNGNGPGSAVAFPRTFEGSRKTEKGQKRSRAALSVLTTTVRTREGKPNKSRDSQQGRDAGSGNDGKAVRR